MALVSQGGKTAIHLSAGTGNLHVLRSLCDRLDTASINEVGTSPCHTSHSDCVMISWQCKMLTVSDGLGLQPVGIGTEDERREKRLKDKSGVTPKSLLKRALCANPRNKDKEQPQARAFTFASHCQYLPFTLTGHIDNHF
jgi:hypothetical protein